MVPHCRCASLTPRTTSLGLLMLAVIAGRPLLAQSTPRSFDWGITGGPAFLTQSLAGHLSMLGPAGSVFVRWSAARRLSLTVEALASHFGVEINHVHGPCPPDAGPFECHEPVGPIGIGAVVAGLHLADSTVAVGGRGSYLLLGGGLYRALRHPSAAGATRLGWTAGVGFLLRPATPRLALEIRYHQMPRWPDDRVSLIPVALAVSW